LVFVRLLSQPLDAFLVYHEHDRPEAEGLAGTLADRGLELARPFMLRPQMRLLTRVDQGSADARYAVVFVTREFLKLHWPRKELDGLATRSRVVAILYGVTEADVADLSPRLAVAAIPGGMVEKLVHLLRSRGAGGGGLRSNGWTPHPDD
jgi:hypothetical protein